MVRIKQVQPRPSLQKKKNSAGLARPKSSERKLNTSSAPCRPLVPEKVLYHKADQRGPLEDSVGSPSNVSVS